MIDHLVLNVRDLERSRRFYQAALEPTGYGVVAEIPQAVGFGTDGRATLWVAQRGAPSSGVHLAVTCGSRDQVDRFHAAALAAGGRDQGAPGLRPHYHAAYYGAFVLDPDGHNLEAVCHAG